MCNSHLDYKIALRDADARTKGVLLSEAPEKKEFSLGAALARLGWLLKGWARV